MQLNALRNHSNPWIHENLQYIWIVLGFALGLLMLVVSARLVSDRSPALDTENMIFFLSLVVIPMTAVNIIYLLKQLFGSICNTPGQIMLLKILGLFAGIILSTLLFEWIYAMYGIVDDDYITLGSYTLSMSESEVISNLITGSLLGIPVFLRQQVKDTATKALEAKKEELSKAHQLNVQSQLEALQARVNPHFLYNSLNSIASLIHINPDQAEKMVLSLSDLFRYSLNYSDGQLSTIAQEVKMVETYLDIELIRFGDKLKCEILIDDALKHLEVPRFLLQPMVENAIKHGASKLTEGMIRVEVKKAENDLVFIIADNGPDFPEEFNAGYGMKCVTDQLELIYPNQHAFGLYNTPEKHVKIILENAATHV